MKTIKYILLICCISCSTILMASTYSVAPTSVISHRLNHSENANAIGYGTIQAPTVQFESTSTMEMSGSSLFNSESDMIIGSNNPNQGKGTNGPRRIIDEEDNDEKPDGWQEPFDDPLGDAVLPLLLLAAGYVVLVARKRRASSLKQ